MLEWAGNSSGGGFWLEDGLKNWLKFDKEPAFYIGLIGSILALATAFGLKLSGQQINAINTLMAIVIPFAAGIVTRGQVYSRQSAEILAALPPIKKSQIDAEIADEKAKQTLKGTL